TPAATSEPPEPNMREIVMMDMEFSAVSAAAARARLRPVQSPEHPRPCWPRDHQRNCGGAFPRGRAGDTIARRRAGGRAARPGAVLPERHTPTRRIRRLPDPAWAFRCCARSEARRAARRRAL